MTRDDVNMEQLRDEVAYGPTMHAEDTICS